MSDPTEHVVIIRANLSNPVATVQVDLGSLNPSVAASLLYQAATALDLQPGPVVSIVFDDKVIAEFDPYAEVVIDDEE